MSVFMKFLLTLACWCGFGPKKTHPKKAKKIQQSVRKIEPATRPVATNTPAAKRHQRRQPCLPAIKAGPKKKHVRLLKTA